MINLEKIIIPISRVKNIFFPDLEKEKKQEIDSFKSQNYFYSSLALQSGETFNARKFSQTGESVGKIWHEERIYWFTHVSISPTRKKPLFLITLETYFNPRINTLMTPSLDDSRNGKG